MYLKRNSQLPQMFSTNDCKKLCKKLFKFCKTLKIVNLTFYFTIITNHEITLAGFAIRRLWDSDRGGTRASKVTTHDLFDFQRLIDTIGIRVAHFMCRFWEAHHALAPTQTRVPTGEQIFAPLLSTNYLCILLHTPLSSVQLWLPSTLLLLLIKSNSPCTRKKNNNKFFKFHWCNGWTIFFIIFTGQLL